MKYTKIPTNFIYPKITPTHYRFGSDAVEREILRVDGDWRGYVPEGELQNRHGIESSACYIEAQQHAIATLQEDKFNILNQDYSARFNALLSGGTQGGGDPLAGADSIRKDGLIADSLLPFSDLIKSWNDFHSFLGTDEKALKDIGKQFIREWDMSYDIVFEQADRIENKYIKLKQALRRSPVPMSVLAWYQDDQGAYIKPPGGVDNHLVLCVYLDDANCPYIFDTYEPFIKKLAPLYDSDFAMRWSIDKKLGSVTMKTPLLFRFLEWLRKIFKHD